MPSLLDQEVTSSSLRSWPNEIGMPKSSSNQTAEFSKSADDVIGPFWRTSGSDTTVDGKDVNQDLSPKELSHSVLLPPQNNCSMTSEEPSHPSLDSSSNSEETAKRPLHEKPRLTLSAYHRREETVRVADSDASRILSDSYDVDGRGCGILGHGAMSTVRIATRRSDGLKVAVKSISKYDVLRSRRLRQNRNRRYLDEWEILSLLEDNPNVVSLLDVFETDDEVQLVLEYCSGGELYSAIERDHDVNPPPNGANREGRAASITSQMLAALDDLHSRGIVHRDVKPENILLTNDTFTTVKLCDFGLARLLVDETDSDSSSCEGDTSPLTPGRRRAFSTVGSDLYAAPEVSTRDGYGTAVDMYSLGVTIYVFICGFPPALQLFADDKDDGKVHNISFPGKEWEAISENAKDLLRKMLDPDPDRRIQADDALKHNWISRYQRSQSPKPSISSARLFSPSKPRPTVDMELVKTRLFLNMDDLEGRKRTRAARGVGRKRRRLSSTRDDDSYIMAAAMQDLYQGVASAAASATAAAAGVICDEAAADVQVMDEEDCEENNSPFAMPLLV